jgi:periplasmic copper chaperone A
VRRLLLANLKNYSYNNNQRNYKMKKIIAAAATSLILLAGCSEPVEIVFEGTLEVSNAYVSATDEGSSMGGMMMAGAFMDIFNNSDESVTLISAESEVAGLVEIHEVVGGVMREKDGGIVIAPDETSVLKPGGNHVMLMELDRELVVGNELLLTLEFSDGTRVDVMAAVKDVSADQEEYDDSHSGM